MAVMLIIACSSQRKATPTAANEPLIPQKEQVWQLVRLQGRPLPLHSTVTTLTINPEAGTANGHTHCNTYSFSCKISHADSRPDGDWYDLSLKLLGSGNVHCSEAEMNAESRYLATLGKATRMCLTATTLTIYQKDKETLYFELQ